MRHHSAAPRTAATLLGALATAATAAAISACAPATPSASPAPSATAAASASAPASAAATARPLQVLFLGHRSEHHNSAAYAPSLTHALVRRGIHLTYEDDPAVALRPERLRHYDAVLAYANHETITPDQEKALLDFVANGGGFVPVHSASFMFKNSPAYIALVGAQFATHDTATFAAQTIVRDHPIMQGLEPFTTYDETYVHTKHNPTDRTVLQERVDGTRREPYTWTRTHGKGRVFYSTLGHVEEAYDNPLIKQMYVEGIKWALGMTEGHTNPHPKAGSSN